MMDCQEGYCDGLAGAGAQERGGYDASSERMWTEADVIYYEGFELGSLDRKTMLHREAAFDRWADGLMNSTAGDVMQAVEPTQSDVDALNRLHGLWADGMGDGNG